MPALKAAIKLALFLLWTFLLIPIQWVVLRFTQGPASYILTRLYHNGVRAIFNIKIEVVGKPSSGQQTLYMSNHLSYLDIVALGSILPASFLAKKEVQSWTLFGTLAELQRTIYIVRKRSAINQARNEMESFLAKGGSLIIFPEGTSTSGLTVLPFKSSLFALALGGDRDMNLQPVTIAITQVDGRKPSCKNDNDIYAWPLEMETSLPVHLWLFAKTSGAALRMTFHEPIKAAAGADRKSLAKACRDSVSKGLEDPVGDNTKQERSYVRTEPTGNHEAASVLAE